MHRDHFNVFICIGIIAMTNPSGLNKTEQRIIFKPLPPEKLVMSILAKQTCKLKSLSGQLKF